MLRPPALKKLREFAVSYEIGSAQKADPSHLPLPDLWKCLQASFHANDMEFDNASPKLAGLQISILADRGLVSRPDNSGLFEGLPLGGF